MESKILVSKEEYALLKQKAMKWDMFVDKEQLTKEEIELIEEAEKSKSLSEKEAKQRFGRYFAS